MSDSTAAPVGTDAEILLKKRARRRLVGAVALAVFAATLLPIIMDHQPRPALNEVQVTIPNPEASDAASRVLPELPSASGKTDKPPVSAHAPAVSTVSAPKKSEDKPVAAAAEKAAADKAAVEKAATDKASADKVAAEKAAAQRKAEAERAARILSGQESKPPAAGSWILQLGAYRDQVNVNNLLNKLKEFDLPGYTEKINTPNGERTRVRAGPFASKEAAEKAQAQLKRIGAGGPPGGVVARK